MRRFGLLVFGVLATVTCGSGDGGSGPPTITAVLVSGDSTVILAGTRQLAATALAGGSAITTGITFQWTSSDGTVASVSNSGLVSGAQRGTVTITAQALQNGTLTGVSGTHAVRVRIGSINLTPGAPAFPSLGDTVLVTAEARNALNAPVPGVTFTWQSRAPSVATATDSGATHALVVAIANGTARIVVTGDGISDSVTSTVQQVATTLSVTPDTVTFGRIDSVLTPAVTATDARGNSIPASAFNWTSQNTGVATVSPTTGAITSKNDGQTRVIAASGSLADTVRVGVALIYSSVEIASTGGLAAPIDSALITRLNGTLQLGVIVRDVGHTVVPSPAVTWSLKTGTIATISGTGLLTGNTSTGRDTVVAVARTVRDGVPLIVRQDVATVVLSPSSPPALNFVADTQRFTATATDDGGSPIPGKTFAWSTSRAILSIDAAGLATADSATSAAGVSVAVRATTDLVTGSANLLVRQIAKTTDAVQVSTSPLTAFGRTATANCTVKDSADVVIPNHACNWEVLTPGVVSFSPASGTSTTLTAIGNGSATIKATAAVAIPSPPFNFNSITVDQVPKTVTISPANLTGPPQLRAGQAAPFFAVVRDSLNNIAAEDTARWSTNNAPVAGVDSLTGVVTAVTAGSATLTATATPASATRDVTVVTTGISYSAANGVRATLNSSCTSVGCHNTSSALADLDLTTANSHADLFEIASTEVPALRRVRAFRPDSSFLVHKIQGTQSVGVRMPEGCPATRPCFSDTTIDLIRNWILQGALNN